MLLKKNQCISVKTAGSDSYMRAKVLSRAGKATGNYRNWVNILSDSGENLCVNWETVEDWELVQESSPPTVEEVNMTSDDKKREISTAKQKQLDNWVKFDAFETVFFIMDNLLLL